MYRILIRDIEIKMAIDALKFNPNQLGGAGSAAVYGGSNVGQVQGQQQQTQQPQFLGLTAKGWQGAPIYGKDEHALDVNINDITKYLGKTDVASNPVKPQANYAQAAQKGFDFEAMEYLLALQEA